MKSATIQRRISVWDTPANVPPGPSKGNGPPGPTPLPRGPRGAALKAAPA
jgi:hypothetical protein